MAGPQRATVLVPLAAAAALLLAEELSFALLEKLQRTAVGVERLAPLEGLPESRGIRSESPDVRMEELKVEVLHSAVALSTRQLAEFVGLREVGVEVEQNPSDELGVGEPAGARREAELADLERRLPTTLLLRFVEGLPLGQAVKLQKEVPGSPGQRGEAPAQPGLELVGRGLALVADEEPGEGGREEGPHVLDEGLPRQLRGRLPAADGVEVRAELRIVQRQLVRALRIEHALQDAMVGGEIGFERPVRIVAPDGTVMKDEQEAHDLVLADAAAQGGDPNGTIMLLRLELELGDAPADDIVPVHAVGVLDFLAALVLAAFGDRPEPELRAALVDGDVEALEPDAVELVEVLEVGQCEREEAVLLSLLEDILEAAVLLGFVGFGGGVREAFRLGVEREVGKGGGRHLVKVEEDVGEVEVFLVRNVDVGAARAHAEIGEGVENGLDGAALLAKGDELLLGHPRGEALLHLPFARRQL